MAAHAALPADGHGAGLAEEQEHLGEAEMEKGGVRLGIQVDYFKLLRSFRFKVKMANTI